MTILKESSNILEEIKLKLNSLYSYKDWKIVLYPWLRTQLTYSSNSIEGNTLSLAQTSTIINDNLSVAGKDLREIYEARNHAQAWDFIQENLLDIDTQELKENDFLKILAFILRDIDDFNAGKYRNLPVRISGSNNIFPNPIKIPDLIQDIFYKIQNTKIAEKFEAIEFAINTHLELVKIHPFTDGNGRTTRLFMNTILMQNGLPPIDIGPENRVKYLESLENSSPNDNPKFTNFCLTQYNQNLDEYLKTFTE